MKMNENIVIEIAINLYRLCKLLLLLFLSFIKNVRIFINKNNNNKRAKKPYLNINRTYSLSKSTSSKYAPLPSPNVKLSNL